MCIRDSYYANQRHLTADELHLSAELSREVAGASVDGGNAASVAAAATAAAAAANGLPHSQGMVLGSGSNADGTVGVDQQQVRQQQRQQQQQDHQVQQPSQAQQHMLQFSSTQQSGVDPNHDLSYGDQSARRKRSKVSRACDECRRKKVRHFVKAYLFRVYLIFFLLTDIFRSDVMLPLKLVSRHAQTVAVPAQHASSAAFQ